MGLLIRTNSGDAIWIYNAVKPVIAAKTTFVVGVVKTNPIQSVPLVNSLKAVNAQVDFSHIRIAHMNDPGVLIEDVTQAVPDVPGDLSAFVVRNVVGVQSVNHLTFSPWSHFSLCVMVLVASRSLVSMSELITARAGGSS